MSSEYLNVFIPIVHFMAEMQGPDTEIILYDVKTCKVCHVENPLDEEMVVGSDMPSLEKSFLDQRRYETEDFIVNYRALSRRKEKLKSATLFLKNSKGILCAILTVNQKVDRLIEMRDLIDKMISGIRPHDAIHRGDFYESFEVSVPNMVTQTMQEEIAVFGIPASRLDSREKMQLVRNLDSKGIFLVKGAVGELARLLETTETTIYRYLSRMGEDNQ